MSEQKQSYFYRAEGNVSLVMASKDEYVYRLFKTPNSDSKMSREELIDRQTLVMSYVKHVMKPLIGEDLVTEGKKVVLSDEEMKSIQQSLTLENVRPCDKRSTSPVGRAISLSTSTSSDIQQPIMENADFDPSYIMFLEPTDGTTMTYRLGKTVDESYVLAMKLPDFCFIPRSTSKHPTFCIEIKPKCGYVSTALYDELSSQSSEPPTCKYCMLQYTKLKNGRCKSVSRFCPVDLFSGKELPALANTVEPLLSEHIGSDKERMRHALKTLFETPQNNLRLFVNGRLVHSEDQQLSAEQSSRLNEILSPLVNGTQNGHHAVNSIDRFYDIVLQCLLYGHQSSSEPASLGVLYSEAPSIDSVQWNCAASSYPKADESSYTDGPQLPYHSVLARILRTQLLGATDAKGVYPYYAKLKQLLQTNPQLRKEMLLDGPFQSYTEPCQLFDDPELNLAVDKVKPFLVAKTAMDCQIMLAIQQLDSGDVPAPGSKVLTDCHGNRQYQFHTAVIDLDPKSVDRMERYMRDAEEAKKSYHEARIRSKYVIKQQGQDWMSKLPAKLHDVPLNQLAIPGSHDSTSFFLDKSVAPGPDCDNVLKELCKYLPQARTIVYNWSKSQALTYTQQLEAGIRYLDLRVSMKAGTEDLFLVHGLYSHKVQDMANAVNEFLQQHPKEVVLLDFNHFYDISDDQHRACLKMLMDVFGDKMCPYLDTHSLTLNTLWENGLQVVAFYQNPIAEENLHFWPARGIVSLWANTPSTDTLIKFLERNYELKRDMNQFYVTQGILTPDTGMVMAHLFSTLKAQCSEKCGGPFVKWLQGKKCGRTQGINVCIMDYVGLFEYISVVLQLNQTLAENL